LQEATTGAGGLATHAEHLQVARRGRQGAHTDHSRVPSRTYTVPHKLPSLLRHGVLPGEMRWGFPTCLLNYAHDMKPSGLKFEYPARQAVTSVAYVDLFSGR